MPEDGETHKTQSQMQLEQNTEKIFIPVPILKFGNPTINFPSPFPGNRKLQPGIRTGNAFIFCNFLMFWLKIVDGGFMKGLWVLFSEFLIF